MAQPTVIRVITWLPVGGIERRLVAVAPRLRDLGWNVRIVCIREEGPLAADARAAGIPLDVIHFPSRVSPPALLKLRRYFQEHRAQVVHSHMYRSNIPATIAGALAGVPAVFGQIHNVESWDSWRQVRMERLVVKRRTATIAVSRAVQEDVMAALRQPRERVPILYNGIDIDAFRPGRDSGAALRRELAISDDEVLFIVPARMHPQKNPLGMLKAAEEALSTGRRGFRLAFAGKGKLEEELRQAAKASAHRDQILFLGERNDMEAVYNAADAIVLSSFKEGFSNAVVEALACGKPVIASDVGGNREAISESRFGWIHDAGDHGALVRQLEEAALRGRPGLAAMAGDCRSRAEHFSIDALVRQTHELYCKALGRTP